MNLNCTSLISPSLLNVTFNMRTRILAATRDVTDRLLGKTRIASISSWFSKGEVEQQIAALEYRVNSMYREFHVRPLLLGIFFGR